MDDNEDADVEISNVGDGTAELIMNSVNMMLFEIIMINFMTLISINKMIYVFLG